MRLPLLVSAATLAAGCALSPCAAAGQTIVGSVRDSATGLPVRGAFLELLDTAGVRVAATLSDSTGAFRFLVVAGRYALHAEAMGYRDVARGPFDLAARGEPSLQLQAMPEPVPLPAIGAEGAPRCKLRRDTVGAVLVVWQQARKTLRLTDWSMKESALALLIRGRENRGFMRDSVWVDTIFHEAPFTTLALDTARTRGLYRVEAERIAVFAPGPDVILSDDFLESHCFALHRDRKRVGLDFFPVHKRPGEIAGTLWLDRDARALQQIEFRYSDTVRPVAVRGAGGTLEFARSPDGYAFIRRWEVHLIAQFGRWTRFRKSRSGEVVKYWVADGK